MEQLTPQEWFHEQIRRAPAFAISIAFVTGILILSTFIEYSSASLRTEEMMPVEATIAQEEIPLIDEIKEKVQPEQPDMKPLQQVPANAPIVEADIPTGAIDAPLGNADNDVEFTEDATADTGAGAVTDPFPIELTKKMATIGTGEGGGGFRGALGNRTTAGKRKAARVYGMPQPKETLKSNMDGLAWLAKAQNADGGWDVQKWGGSQVQAVSGVSGLALLAFLGYGCTDRDKTFGPNVQKAIKFLISRQKTEGSTKGWFGERMYEQGICTMALSEASMMLENRVLRAECKRAAQAGLEYILSKQPSHGGFAYTGPGTDTSITGWQIMAIKSAVNAELVVPSDAKEKCERFLEVCMNKTNYSTPYQISPTGNSASGTPRMTAVSLTCRLFFGHKRNAPDCVGQAKFLTANDEHLKIAEKGLDLYYIYYMSLAMFQMGGEYWKEWNDKFNKGLRESQEKEGPDKGSWPVQGTCFGAHGGRVYTTAMACLALEVYYRFLPMYKGFE